MVQTRRKNLKILFKHCPEKKKEYFEVTLGEAQVFAAQRQSSSREVQKKHIYILEI